MAYLRRTRAMDLLFESLIVIFIASIGAFAMLGYYSFLSNRAREVLLSAELRNIRTAISLFKGFEGRYPKNLKELSETNIPIATKLKKFSDKYLIYQRLNEEGLPMDPFGNMYKYNPESGRVYSKTPKYSNW